jgi:hypothetical protein
MRPIAPSGPPSRDRCLTRYRSLVEPTSNRLLTHIANEQTMPAHPAPLLLAA